MKNGRTILLLAATTLMTVLVSAAVSQEKPVGAFEGQTDVGNPANAGQATYDPEKQEYTIQGSGTNMWAGRDEFHFVWRRLKGNFILTSRVAFVGKGVEEHRKIGWIVRSSLDADSPHAVVVVHGDGLTSLQFRKTTGAVTEQVISPVKGADVLQLERKGDNYIMSVARFGDPFASEQVSLNLGELTSTFLSARTTRTLLRRQRSAMCESQYLPKTTLFRIVITSVARWN